MHNNFDCIVDRRQSGSIKWKRHNVDVLPMWVADTDFLCPQPIIEALRARVEHGIFGYTQEPPHIRELIVDWLFERHHWKISPEDLVFLPGVVNGLNLIYRTFAKPNDGVLVQTPVYPPFIDNPPQAGLTPQYVELAATSPGGGCEINYQAFEGAIEKHTRLFTLCNPHNPLGKVFDKKELEGMAEICLKHGILICSDDIHCDLVYPEKRYIPIASLHKEIEQASITLISPSKTFNIAGFKFAAAIISNPVLRQKLITAKKGLDLGINSLAYTAAAAAYKDCQNWLGELMGYLANNKRILCKYVQEELPGIRMAEPHGTYLGWLDCRETQIQGNPSQFFLDHALLATSDGSTFGPGGEGFIRLNFGCPESVLLEGLKRLKKGLANVS